MIVRLDEVMIQRYMSARHISPLIIHWRTMNNCALLYWNWFVQHMTPNRYYSPIHMIYIYFRRRLLKHLSLNIVFFPDCVFFNYQLLFNRHSHLSIQRTESPWIIKHVNHWFRFRLQFQVILSQVLVNPFFVLFLRNFFVPQIKSKTSSSFKRKKNV